MEIDTNGDIVQRERSLITLRSEGKFAILIAPPEDTTLAELHLLIAGERLTLSSIRSVEGEGNLLGRNDADRDVGLLLKLLRKT